MTYKQILFIFCSNKSKKEKEKILYLFTLIGTKVALHRTWLHFRWILLFVTICPSANC